MHNTGFSRHVFVVMVTAIISQGFVESQNQYTISGDRDKTMNEEHVLKTLVMDGKTMDYCLGQCLQDCLCMSFQICHMTECQLCSSNKFRNSSALRSKKGCTNFVFQNKRSEKNNQQCDRSCNTPINCCMTSNPCYNSGTCLPRNKGKSKIRFTCKCPDGYTGYRCQKPIRSCRGYSDGNRVAGKYKVFDKNMISYEVFCDFDDNSTMAWTLVQSNQRDQKVYTLSYDKPLNQGNFSWDSYRLSKPKMESIRNDSTMWRATCQFPEQGCSHLVRGFNDKMDILTDMDGCFEVEYINIHGHSCSNCTVHFVQNDRCTFHFHAFDKTSSSDCEFNEQLKRVYQSNLPKLPVHYFGCYYYYYYDTNHCCSQSSTATTQIWFGGN